MEFERFAFIVRFRPETGNIDKNWNVLFDFFCPSEVTGCKLYYKFDDTYQMYPYAHFVIVIANMSVKQARCLTVRFKNEFKYMNDLVFISPFPQNNDFRNINGFIYIGEVGENGFISGGDETSGKMQFSGSIGNGKRKKSAVLFVPTEYDSGNKVVNIFLKSYPDYTPIIYPDFIRSKELVSWIATDNCAAYYRTSDGSPYFRFYDDAVIFKYENEDTNQKIIFEASERGFRRFTAVTDSCTEEILANDNEIEFISTSTFIKRYLRNSRLHKAIMNADLIVCSQSMKKVLIDLNIKERKIAQL